MCGCNGCNGCNNCGGCCGCDCCNWCNVGSAYMDAWYDYWNSQSCGSGNNGGCGYGQNNGGCGCGQNNSGCGNNNSGCGCGQNNVIKKESAFIECFLKMFLILLNF